MLFLVMFIINKTSEANLTFKKISPELIYQSKKIVKKGFTPIVNNFISWLLSKIKTEILTYGKKHDNLMCAINNKNHSI